MKHSEIVFGVLRIPVDFALALCALLAAYQLRIVSIDLVPTVQLLSSPTSLPTLDYYLSSFALPASFALVLVLAAMGLYSLKSTIGPWREMLRVVTGSLLWLALVIAWFFLVTKQLFYSRILLLQATLLLAIFLMCGRIVILMIQRLLLRRGIGVRTVLSCGGAHLPASVAEHFTHDVRYRYVGHVKTNTEVAEAHLNAPLDLVLHTDPNPVSSATLELIEYCRSHQIGYAFLPPVFADVPHQLSIGHLGLTPMLRFEPTPLDGWGRVWKRVLDILFGLTLLILLSPLLLLIALAIIVSCGFPVLYVSKRVGLHGNAAVPLLKFRTMCRDADKAKQDMNHLNHRQDGPLFKIKEDPRILPLGHILRRWSLDELPQLLNVVMGHLSLVGPRPHLKSEVEKYALTERRVFTVRPGITGLAQISGRSNLSFNEEVQLDMRYIEDWSLALDLWVLWRTIFVVLSGRGAD